MIGAIENIISNPTLYNMTQSTVTQVTSETCLKAIGRPSFILMDKQIDPQTKKFSATKEFLYQLTCLAIYLSMIHQFKKASFAIGRKLFKNEDVFKAFKHTGDFMNYYKMDEAARANKLNEINKALNSGDKFVKEKLNLNLGKGIIEGSSIVGTVLGLAVLAPIVSHPLIHPILKVMGLDKTAKKADDKKPAKVTAQPEPKSDAKQDNAKVDTKSNNVKKAEA